MSASLADGEWHRLHPLTPLFKGGLALIIVAGVVISNFRERLVAWVIALFTPDTDTRGYSSGDPVDWILDNNYLGIASLILLGVVVLLVLIFWVVWRFQQFRITGEHVEVRKGIVFRSHRRAPLDRVQGVNLTRPFPARLIGLAKLEVTGAGTDADVPLEYLSTAKAEAVRAEILRLASGARAVRHAAAAGGEKPQFFDTVGQGVTGLVDGVDLADVAPESVVKIPAGRLIGSQLISGLLWLVFFGGIAAVALSFAIPAVIREEGDEAGPVVIALVLGIGLPMVLVAVAVTWAQISRSLRYAIAPTPDGVRITFGLFTTVTETIPPGRIFAAEVSQSLLWRPFGWWTIKINRMTGKSASQQQSGQAQQFSVVLPVGKRADVERVLGLILPDFPARDAALLWDHGILGPREGDPYYRMPARAWWRRPVSWQRHGFAVTEYGLLLRRGRVWRKLAVFPLARLQGLSVSQGPIDRLQRVGWLKAHSVIGPVLGEVVGIERDVLMHTLDDVARRASAAVQQDHSHRWAENVATVIPAAPVGWTRPGEGHPLFPTNLGGSSSDESPEPPHAP